MPEIIQGDGTVPTATRTQAVNPPASTTSAFVKVNSTTNATPVAVATSVAHGFYTGDTVEMEGASSLSGVHVITVTGTNGFTLNGTTAPGWVGGSTTSYVSDVEVQPAFQLADPGEPASMTTLAPVIQGILNAIPWLYRLTGRRRTHQVFYGTPAGAAAMAVANYGNSGWNDGGAVKACPTANTYYTIPETLTALSLLTSDLTAVQTPSFYATDELDITYQGGAQLSASTVGNVGFLLLTLSDGTTTINAGQLNSSAANCFGGTSPVAASVTDGTRPTVPFNMRMVVSVLSLQGAGLTQLGAGGPLSIGLAFVPYQSDTSGEIFMVGPAQITVIQRRVN